LALWQFAAGDSGASNGQHSSLGSRQPWEIRPNGVGDVVRREMSIVALGHTRVSVAKLPRDDGHWDGAHGENRLNKLALASGFFVFVGMVILFAFAQIPARDRVTRLAGQSLVAAVALATVIFIGSSLWAAMFCAPPGFVYLYGLDGVCRSQPSLPPKTPDPQPKVTEAQPRAVEAQPKISEIASFEYNDKFGKVSVEKDHYEGSKADIAEDKRQAKKRGMSMKEWEASPEDRAMDAAGGGISADYTIDTLESSFQKRQRSVRTGGTVGLPILRVKCFRRTQARLYEWLAATGPGPRL